MADRNIKAGRQEAAIARRGMSLIPVPAFRSATTQAGEVAERLRRDILSCRLRPGVKLRINELAVRFEVSPGAVREALAWLAAEGLTIARAQRGFSVAPVSADDLRDLTATRVMIECLCVRDAIAHGDRAWEASLVAAAELLRELPERDADDASALSDLWATDHGTFHAALVSGGRSPTLLRIRQGLYAQAERYRYLSVPLREGERDVNAEHWALVEAALDRDADRLCALLGAHLWQTAEILLTSPVLAQDASPAA